MSNRHATTMAAGERIRVGRDEISLRVTSDASKGALLVAAVTLPAGGGPPALHRHAAEEVYRVERGELTIYLDDGSGEVQRIVAEPGSVNHIPGGRAHTIRNESDAEATAYVVFAPGHEMEAFFRAAGALAADGPPDVEAVLALAARHGIDITGALPAQD